MTFKQNLKDEEDHTNEFVGIPKDYMKYCEKCGISEEDYGFDFDTNEHGEWVCESCLED